MTLNNDWQVNIDDGKWTPGIDSLKKTDFDALKQDLKKLRFYQKCLSGSTYVAVDSNIIGSNQSATIDDIYGILSLHENGYFTQSTYYYNSLLPYIQPPSLYPNNNPSVISNTQSLDRYIDNILPDYNMTLKNLFTPERLINDQKENVFYVDIVTDDKLDSVSGDLTGLIVDGVRVKEGHRILVKNQFDYVTIPALANPDNFFQGKYELDETVNNTKKYKVYNSDNGIYKFTNRRLLRSTDIDLYDGALRYSICSKLGDINRERQFKLARLRSGLYPLYTNNDPIYFEESHNFVVRNRVDYNNLYELSLQDTIKHATQSLIVSNNIVVPATSATCSFSVFGMTPSNTIEILYNGISLTGVVTRGSVSDSSFMGYFGGLSSTINNINTTLYTGFTALFVPSQPGIVISAPPGTIYNGNSLTVNINGTYSSLNLTPFNGGTNSSTVAVSSTYSIPPRAITIGEFGVIINHQEGITSIIDSKYKTYLRSITQTSRYYWVCGDEGILLRIDKIDFKIKRIELKFKNTDSPSDVVITKLNSVEFFNDLRGVVVGKFNQIWVTSDGGNNWEQIYLSNFDGYNFNKVLFATIDTFYVGGDNGVFIDFEYSLGEWFAHKRRISKYIDGLDDEYLLVDDIREMSYYTQSGGFVSIGCELGKIFIYDISNSFSSWDFICIEGTSSDVSLALDITGLTWVDSYAPLIFLSTFESVYYLSPFAFPFIGTNSNIINPIISTFSTDIGVNGMYYYTGGLGELMLTGNLSLWKTNNGISSVDVYDSTFFQRLKPRMLFLDYDIGSKLYWFDDYGQYRLPERIEFPVSYMQDVGSQSYIGFNRNVNSVYNSVTSTTFSYLETNWITYWKDRSKTFEYYTDLEEAFVVEPSFTFSSSDAIGKTFSYATPSVTTSYLDIVDLMPTAVPPMQVASITQSSRFRDYLGPAVAIPSTTYDLYFYDYLGIWHNKILDTDYPSEVGDVLEISSDVFEGKFVINKIISTCSIQPYLSATTLVDLGFGTFFNFTPPTYIYINVFYGTTSLTGGPLNNNSISDSQFFQNITDAINNNTLSTGFSAVYNSVTGFIIITAPPGSSYNATDVVFKKYAHTMVGLVLILPVLNKTLSGGSDEMMCDYYNYFYTDFNQNILNNIPNSSGITVRDLNKYPQDITKSQYFIDNFNSHYISYAYECDEVLSLIPGIIAGPPPTAGITQSFRVTPKFSQFSAYYNLQSTADMQDVYAATYSQEINYPTGFLNFGYSPTYNLLSYLNFIDDSKYTPTKEFLAMPIYIDIPGPDNISFSTQSSIYIDIGLETNKLIIGSDLKHVYDTLFKWTFVDVLMDRVTNPQLTERLLIIEKYYDSDNDWYIIEFHKKLDYTISTNIYLIDIISRRTLQQISDDLQYINRLHRPEWLVSESQDGLSIGGGGTWSNYETQIDFKVPTDSYTKVLLSDNYVIRDLTSLIYTDYKYELAMQVTKLNRSYELNVMSVGSYTINSIPYYRLNFSTILNDIDNIDYVVVSVTSTQSSYPPQILGYHNIRRVPTSNTSMVILVPFSGGIPSPVKLKVSFIRKDHFLNFQPVDIFGVGIGDKKIKKAVEVLTENYEISGSKYNIINLDLNRFRYRLVDGLDIVSLNANYPWILEAEISNAIIGMDKNGPIWYKGVWYCGRWFEGTWISGSWLSGDWYGGKRTSRTITDEKLSVKIDNQNTNQYSSVWYDGRWFGGNWENGTWYEGRWYGGTFSNGRWFDGTWNDGVWDNGTFQSGIWVLGQWNNGLFNTDNGPVYWLDGRFFGGDFENGIWYDGIFDQKNDKISRFGTKSSNSRNSVWRSGKFLSGQFHSYLNIDDNGNPDVSDVHKYSKWKTGIFSSGDFYGGISSNIAFKNAKWHGGISEDIEVVYVNATASSFLLKGEFDFNINDEFYIVDGGDYNQFSMYGTLDNPKKYKSLTSNYDSDSDITTVAANISLSNLFSNLGNPQLDGLWSISEINTNFSGSYNTYLSGGGVFDEIVEGSFFIHNQSLLFQQDNTPAPVTVPQSSLVSVTYNNISIDLTSFISVISPSQSIFDITFSQDFTSATFSLTQSLSSNPTGVVLDFSLDRVLISGSVSNLRCVSGFENSSWDSGIWWNGVFKKGTFNGGLWYDGYFDGSWG